MNCSQRQGNAAGKKELGFIALDRHLLWPNNINIFPYL